MFRHIQYVLFRVGIMFNHPLGRIGTTAAMTATCGPRTFLSYCRLLCHLDVNDHWGQLLLPFVEFLAYVPSLFGAADSWVCSWLGTLHQSTSQRLVLTCHASRAPWLNLRSESPVCHLNLVSTCFKVVPLAWSQSEKASHTPASTLCCQGCFSLSSRPL